jgi:hypothetical protein
MICDATLKADAGTISLPTKEIMMDALRMWQDIGLPDFTIPKRTKLRMDRA